jgi:tetratricopeptide (TPR) repeat protein
VLVTAFVLGCLGGPIGGGTPAHAQPLADPADIASLRARQAFIQGMTQAYLEDYEEAAVRFEQALEAAPGHPAILSALADAEAHRGNLSSALYYARQARDTAPDTPYYHLELARLLRRAHQPEDATAAYRQLLARFPGHLEGRRALAQLHTERGRARAALRQYEVLVDSSRRPELGARTAMLDLYRQVGDEDGLERTLQTMIQLQPETPRYRRQLSQLYVEQGRRQEAIAVLEPQLRRTPRDPRLLSRLQMLYTETGQPEKADTLGRAVVDADASPDQLVDRARMLYARQDTRDTLNVDSVVDLLRSVLEQTPDHAGALDLLGTIRYDQERYAAAASLLDRALDANPRSLDRWRRAISASLETDSLRRAVVLAEEAQLLFPGRPDLMHLEARARLQLGDPDRARDRFRKALAHIDTSTTSAGERARLHLGLGQSWQRLGALDSAVVAYEDALRLAPASARLPLARALAEQETQLDRALRLAQRAVRTDAPSPAALGTLGWVHTVRREYEKAAAAFEQALQADPAPAWVYERFGDLQHTLGNDARARQYWKQALDRTDRPAPLRQKLQSVPQS